MLLMALGRIMGGWWWLAPRAFGQGGRAGGRRAAAIGWGRLQRAPSRQSQVAPGPERVCSAQRASVQRFAARS